LRVADTRNRRAAVRRHGRTDIPTRCRRSADAPVFDGGPSLV